MGKMSCIQASCISQAPLKEGLASKQSLNLSHWSGARLAWPLVAEPWSSGRRMKNKGFGTSLLAP